MSEHKNTAQISSQQHVTCIHCHRTFKSERSLAEHTVKNHQKFSASVSYKIHQCTKCPYKTIFKTKLSAHIVKHTNPVTYYKPYTCIHCNATFTSKSSLDDHIVRKHPEFMESVLGKIHSCTLCSYKSTRKSSLTRHMVKHPETQINCSFIMCIHCNAKFKTQQGIDEHIVKEHPDFITTISEKIHECTQCKYKTTRMNKLTAHMLMHQKAASKQAGSLCTHCNLMFKHKHGLEEHTVRRHPDKTTLKTRLRGHIAVHPDLDNRNVRNCIHCNATFKTKQGLDEHIVKKHPDLIASLSRKIYSCEYCPYLTITKTCFTEHMLRHPSEISVI
nr:unnamed protein product [Callosobruchus chinensis]